MGESGRSASGGVLALSRRGIEAAISGLFHYVLYAAGKRRIVSTMSQIVAPQEPVEKGYRHLAGGRLSVARPGISSEAVPFFNGT